MLFFVVVVLGVVLLADSILCELRKGRGVGGGAPPVVNIIALLP